MKKVILFGVVVTILIGSGLGYAFISNEANRKGIENLNSEIKTIDSDLTSLPNKLTTLNSSLTQLSKDLGNMNMTKQDIESLQTSADRVQANIVTIQENISSLGGTVGTVQGDLEKAQTQIATAQAQMTSLSENITSIQTQVTQIIDDVNGLATNVTKITNDARSLENDITALQNDVSTLKTQMISVQAQVAIVLTDISNIQATTSSLQSEIADLNASKSTVIRVWIRSLTTSDLFGSSVPNNLLSYMSGVDWLIDAQVTWNGSVISQSRTGHSRFFTPEYVDLSVLGINRTQLLGQNVLIELVAYWHAQDAVIDINPTHNHPWNDRWDGYNNELSIDYTVGSEAVPVTITGDGSPRYILFPRLYPITSNWYSYATMTYQIETF